MTAGLVNMDIDRSIANLAPQSRVKHSTTEPLRSLSAAAVVIGFVCFVALRPKSTAMVIAGRSVHLTTLFSWASLNKQLTSNRAHTFACN